jgi:hypothetical protein
VPDVRIEGLDTFISTMDKAAKALQDMGAAHRSASALIASAVAAAAPRRTGRLSSSVRATGGRSGGAVDVTAPYAGPIEWGWPSRHIDGTHFAMNAARATEPQWVKYYEDAVAKAIDEVKGK